MRRPPGGVVTVVLAAAVHTTPGRAADRYVTPEGRPTGRGTEQSPWDIASALGGGQRSSERHALDRPGTYHAEPKVGGPGLRGPPRRPRRRPIRIRARPGAGHHRRRAGRPAPPTHLEIRDLELTVSEPRPAPASPARPSYRNVNRPWGGLNVSSGTGCKFINLVLHGNSQGVSWWPSRPTVNSTAA